MSKRGQFMKKFLYVFLFATLLFTSFPSLSKAEGSVSDGGKSKEVVYSEPAYTEYRPTQKLEKENQIKPLGLDFARGTVSCYVMDSDAFCPWNIQVGGDVITYSNVTVVIEKNHGFLSGGWKHFKTHYQTYPVNISTSTIRGEVSNRLASGSYRVKLGGNFTTMKNGVYQAWANGYSYFEIK
jgi:hypothetical protein